MEARAWRLAGGAAVALLVLVGLVAWRADSLAGGWLLSLRLTGLLAVAGLLTAVVLATRTALRPPAPAAVVVRVPVDGAPRTTAQAARAAAVPLQAVVLLAVVTAAPVLGVLVLATGPDAERSSATGDGAAPLGGPSASETPSPSTSTSASPSTSPSSSPSPSAGGSSPSPSSSTAPSTAPSSAPQPAQPVEPSPAQLPSEAAGRAVCEQVVVAGDSLWSVAAAQLGPGASDADVDARWRALYARNAAAVGPDPDRVLPGLQLSTCA